MPGHCRSRRRLPGTLPQALRLALLTVVFASVPSLAADVVERRDALSCGGTYVTAQAACYGVTRLCVRETLTFHRPEGTTVIAPHKRIVSHPAIDGGMLDALDYRAASWACVPGANGGRYIAFVMAHASGERCNACEYLSVYHPWGRHIASSLRFDAEGRPLADRRSGAVIRELLGDERPAGFRPLYDR